jgi:hypothetical protein
VPSLRSVISNLRAQSGHFQPERLCALRPRPGAARHILVLAIAHDDRHGVNLSRLAAPQRDRGLAALAERMKRAVRLMGADLVMQPVKSRGHWRVVFLCNRPPNSKAAGVPPT